MLAAFKLPVAPLVALALVLVGPAEAHPEQPVVDRRTALAATVLDSTTQEWSAAFAAKGRSFDAPRPIYLDPPRHHPARGFGYFRGVGVEIDLGELVDIQHFLGADGDAIVALIIAHEVAHHVQHLNEQRRGSVQPSGFAREQEADCAAGWWLGRANMRHAADSGDPLFKVPDLDRQLPRIFQALDTLRNGRLAFGEADYSTGHGLSTMRIMAVRRGLSATDVTVCGAGVTP